MIHEAAARGFAQAAEAYERGRPGYPPEAVEHLCAVVGVGPGRAVLDLAAGTGKLTRLLVATGAELVAVEPVEEMRAVLARALPEVTALAGTAEDVPLPDASVEAVVVGSAFHWFHGDGALAEIHRALRPGGRLGLLWNVRDESVPWVAELSEIMEPYRGAAPGYRSGAWREAFGRTQLFSPLRHAGFRHVHRLEPEAVVARVASVSFVAALSESDRAAVLARVRALLARDPATRGREVVELPYRTDVYWCTRRLDAAADDGEAPGPTAREELVRIDVVEPADEVPLRSVVRGAVDGRALGRARGRVVSLAALELLEALLGGRPFGVSLAHA